MLNRKLFAMAGSVMVLLLLVSFSAEAQERGNAVMWEPVKISQRNLYLGPGGTQYRPNVRKVTFIKKETGGSNKKYRIKDASGRVWVAKIANESQPETAAVRLLWGIGYRTEINYLVPEMTIPGEGTFKNVRLEARPDGVKRGDRWNWEDNPFAGTDELQGLKVIMALINNWDLKGGNNIILESGGERQYVVSDLGSAFGKYSVTNFRPLYWLGRTVNKPEQYAKSKFINGTDEEGEIEFAYRGAREKLFRDIRPQDARWAGRLLSQLSDKQINDAFRAANYTAAERRTLTRALKERIRALDQASNGLEARRSPRK